MLGHWNNSPWISIILITSLYSYLLSGEATNINLIVFGLTQSWLEPTIYHTQGDHANNYTTDALQLTLLCWYCTVVCTKRESVLCWKSVLVWVQYDFFNTIWTRTIYLSIMLVIGGVMVSVALITIINFIARVSYTDSKIVQWEWCINWIWHSFILIIIMTF